MPQRVTDFAKAVQANNFTGGVIDQQTADHLARNMIRKGASQETAATAALSAGHVRQAGRIVGARALVRAAAAAGETMVVDVLKNGATVLTGTFTFDNTVAAGAWQTLSLDLAQSAVALGDHLEVDLTYTAGGGPTPVVGTLVELDIE